MSKIVRKTNTFCLFAVFVVLAAFLAGCKPESSEKAAQTDDQCVLKISKGCATADTDENGQTSEDEAAAYYGSKLEENRQRLEDHNFAMMRKFDSNKDGRLKKSEQSAYREFRANLLNQSTAENGSARSVPSAPAKKTAQTNKPYTPKLSEGCITADKDENGQTSEEEAAEYYGSNLKKNRKRIESHNLVMMQAYDTNKDGRLEKGELGEYLQFRAALVGDIEGISKGCTKADKNEDGQTSEEEAAAYFIKSKLEENREKIETHNLTMMKIYDTNKDGRLEKRELGEYLQRRATLLHISAIKTGSVQPARSVSAVPPENTAQTDSTYLPRISDGCTTADKDENGQTSEEEAAAYYGSKLEENRKKLEGHNLVMMQTYDTNKDGRLEKSELGGYLQLRTALLRNIPGLSKGCTKADKDENGQTSEEEAAEYYGSELEKNRQKLEAHNLAMMQTYDTNKDGRLEKSELGEYLQTRATLLHIRETGAGQ